MTFREHYYGKIIGLVFTQNIVLMKWDGVELH